MPPKKTPRLEDLSKLKIISWNVRNLTESNLRPGSKGGGLNIKERADTVSTNIKSRDPDIIFILEASIDSEGVADMILGNLPGYRSVQSGMTPSIITATSESYIMIFKYELKNYISIDKLIGTTLGYRQGWLVPIKGATGIIINLLVLHAPSPGHNITERLKIIGDVVSETQKITKNEPLLLMGDLNIKSDELSKLDTTLGSPNPPGLGFTYLGPKDLSGKPQNTTLKKYINILLKDISESQPYDQFWICNNNNYSISSVSTGKIGLSLRDYQLLQKNLIYTLSNINNDLGSITIPTESKNITSDYTSGCKLNQLYNEFISQMTTFNKNISKVKQLLASNGYKVSEWEEQFQSISNKLQTSPIFLNKPGAKVKMNSYLYGAYEKYLDTIVYQQVIINKIIYYQTEAKMGTYFPDEVTFEQCISDHLSIQIEISF